MVHTNVREKPLLQQLLINEINVFITKTQQQTDCHLHVILLHHVRHTLSATQSTNVSNQHSQQHSTGWAKKPDCFQKFVTPYMLRQNSILYIKLFSILYIQYTSLTPDKILNNLVYRMLFYATLCRSFKLSKNSPVFWPTLYSVTTPCLKKL